MTSYNNAGYAVYAEKDKTIFSNKQEIPEVKEKTSSRHVFLISTVVCVVTAAVVCAIAVPVTISTYDCECDNDVYSCSTTPVPTKPTSTPPKSTTVNHGPLREPLAQTAYGPVMGHEVDMGTGDPYDNVMSYLGVRYARPPKRWEKPEEPENFTTVYEASTLRSLCIQNLKIIHATQQYWENTSEDCLFVNIYSPMDTGTKYPVLLWIHGGGYQNGGNIQYPGQTLAQRGVVVVVTNYRLNIFGFASTEDGLLEGNYGMWDQRQAMLYIQKTIEAYGGDPTRVTISGESAGAASTGLHLVSPTTKGLFHQAIFESGNYVTMWAMNAPIDQPGTYLPQVANDVGCPSGNTTLMVECLKSTNASVLLEAKFDCPFCLGFEPVMDGPGGFLPQMPLDTAMHGGVHNVSILTGVNSGECSVFVVALAPFTLFENAGFNRTTFQEILMAAVDFFYYVVTETDVTPSTFYKLINWYYSPLPDIDNLTDNKVAVTKLCTDGAFNMPNAETVKFQAEKATVYMYVNGIMPLPLFPRNIPPWLVNNVGHMMELPYVWGWPSVYFGTESFQIDTGNLTLPFVCWGEQDILWTDWFQTLWTNFVKSGNPTPTPVTPPIENALPVTWEMYDNTNYSYLFMHNTYVENQREYRLKEGTMWSDYIPNLIQGRMIDDVNPIPMGPLKRTQWLNPTVAEALGVTIAPLNPRKKRSLPEEVPMRHPITAQVINPTLDIIKKIVLTYLEQEVENLNATLIANRNMTINEVMVLLEANWPEIQDSRCYKSVVPFAIDLLMANKEFVMKKIEELAAKKGITLPPGVTLPPNSG